MADPSTYQAPTDTNGAPLAIGTASDTIAEIEAYEKDYLKWETRGDAIIKRYRDERSEASNMRVVNRKFNILWSNTETLKPTLYARLPRLQVERRFKDADPQGRTACEIAERTGNYILETSPFDNVMRLCVQDLLLPGRGAAWINYRAKFQEKEADEETEAESDPQTELEKIQDMIEVIYVAWKDFGHSPKRTWQEVTRAWRICYMLRPELVERFGEKLGNEIPLDRKKDDSKDSKADGIHDTATVYEVWNKKTHKVCWVHKSQKDYLDETDPPVDLEGFWPFARPLWANLTNDTLIPIPLYALYQDQAAELDKLTNRIGRFTDGLKLAGVCDANVPELVRLLSPNGSPDNSLIPVANYAGLKEKGGIAGAVDLLPLTDIANTLLSLYEAREQVLSVIYQVTGLADIIRGASNPNETATAQSIKGQFASLRIKDTQAEVARFSRDNARIIVEIAVEMYEPETLYEMVQADQFCKPSPREEQRNKLLQQFGLPPQKPMDEFMQALRLLRNDKMRSFHVDIETDSTIALNEQEDKQAVTEFLTALGQFVGSFGPMVQQMPQLAPVAGEALLFATRRYKAGRSLENSIEKAMRQIVAAAQGPKPPSPEQQAAQAKMAEGQQKMQIAQQKAGLDAQAKQQDLAFRREEHQQDLSFEREKFAMETEQDQRKFMQDQAQDAAAAEQKRKLQNVVPIRS